MALFSNHQTLSEQEFVREQAANHSYEATRNVDMSVSAERFFNDYEEPRPELLQITLDHTSLINDIENTLRGRIQDINEQGAIYWRRIGSPVMNDEGINATLQVISGTIGKNTILANLTKEKVVSLCTFIYFSLIELFAGNSKRFGIDPTRRTTTIRQVLLMVYQSMTRSIDAKERQNVYGRTKEIAHRQYTDAHVNNGRGGWNFLGR